MSEYLITCVRKSERTAAGHKHITSVGIGGQRYTVAQIYQFIDVGHTFRTASGSTGREAPVTKYQCCGLNTLRSYADRYGTTIWITYPSAPDPAGSASIQSMA